MPPNHSLFGLLRQGASLRVDHHISLIVLAGQDATAVVFPASVQERLVLGAKMESRAGQPVVASGSREPEWLSARPRAGRDLFAHLSDHCFGSRR